MQPEAEFYTVKEVAAKLKLDRRTVTALFIGEKGVLIIDRPATMHKRRYRTIRIPHHVYERVLRRLSN